MQGDPELNYAYFALHECGIPPGTFAKMSRREKAVLFAFIDIRVQARERMLQNLQA